MHPMNHRRLIVTLCAVFCAASQAGAQQSTVYVAVVATKLFVVGAANPQTGIFFQRPGEDTTWQHTGPKTIRAFGVAVPAGARGRVVYIAGGNGVHRTGDGGAHWKITTDWPVTEVLGVTCDPRDTNTVYCATPYGVYKTTDGCASWQEKNRGLIALFTSCIMVDNATPGRVYAATEDGLYVSTDGAEHWTRSSLSVPQTRVIVQHPKDPAVLMAGTENNGIYVSRDGGKVWTRSEAGVDHLTFYAIAFDPGDPEVVYAGGYITGVYKSADGGRSWRRVNAGLENLNVHAIAVDPVNSRRVYAATLWGGIYRTDDGGASWRSAGLAGAQIWNIIIHPF